MKLIASDYDGTLSFQSQIPPENREAVARWRAAGNQFVIVTGRPYIFASDILLNTHAPCDALIACNGGMFLNGQAQITHKITTDPRVLPPLVRLIYNHSPILVVYSEGGSRIEYSEENGELLIHPEENNFQIPDFLTVPRSFAQICVCVSTPEGAHKLARAVNEAFPGKLNAKPNDCNCDITCYGVQKPLGIRRYVESLSQKPEEILTVGDNFNDISMLEAYTGHAIAGSHTDVIRAAHGRTVASIADMVDRYL